MKISKRAKEGPRSGIREMFDLARNYDNVVNLGIGEPGFATPQNILEAGVNALRNGYTKYTPNAGMIELRQALAKKVTEKNGLTADPNKNLIVTTGAGEAMMLSLFAIVDPGDEVILADPYFPNYLGQISLAGAKPVFVKTYEKDGFHMKADAIEAAITPKTKVVIINSPSNPTGAVLSKEELEEIAEVVKRHNLIVLSDEPYEVLVYDDKEHVSIGSLHGMSDHVITINSFSKSYTMTGWRVGYAHGPSEVILNMVKLQESVASCVNASAQMACVEALEGSQASIEEMKQEYLKRRNYLIEELNRMPGISCITPEGAFYAFANIKEFGKTSLEVAKILLKEVQLVVTPGSAFGEAGEGYLRFSYAADMENIVEGIERLKKFLK